MCISVFAGYSGCVDCKFCCGVESRDALCLGKLVKVCDFFVIVDNLWHEVRKSLKSFKVTKN